MSPAHLRTREFQKSVASLSFRQNSLLRVGDDRYNEVVYTFAAIWALATLCTLPLQVPERKRLHDGKDALASGRFWIVPLLHCGTRL